MIPKDEFEKLKDSQDEHYRGGISELWLLYQSGKLTPEQEQELREKIASLKQKIETNVARFQKKISKKAEQA